MVLLPLLPLLQILTTGEDKTAVLKWTFIFLTLRPLLRHDRGGICHACSATPSVHTSARFAVSSVKMPADVTHCIAQPGAKRNETTGPRGRTPRNRRSLVFNEADGLRH